MITESLKSITDRYRFNNPSMNEVHKMKDGTTLKYSEIYERWLKVI